MQAVLYNGHKRLVVVVVTVTDIICQPTAWNPKSDPWWNNTDRIVHGRQKLQVERENWFHVTRLKQRLPSEYTGLLFTRYPSPSPSINVPSSDKISATIPKNGNVYNRTHTPHTVTDCMLPTTGTTHCAKMTKYTCHLMTCSLLLQGSDVKWQKSNYSWIPFMSATMIHTSDVDVGSANVSSLRHDSCLARHSLSCNVWWFANNDWDNATLVLKLVAMLRWFTAACAIRYRSTTTFANLEITSFWRHWWRHNSETITDREKRRPPRATKSSELSNGENRIAPRQLLQNRKWRHWWRHNLGSRWKFQKMARENFSVGAFYNITKNQDNPIKTVGRDIVFFEPQNP